MPKIILLINLKIWLPAFCINE